MKQKDEIGLLLSKAIESKNVFFLCKYHFKTDISDKQAEIIRAIMFKEHKRVIISAYTRYGKSWAVAQGILLYIWMNDNKRIRLIAPLMEQTTILRNYITQFMLESKEIRSLLEIDAQADERIRSETSKSRITFKNRCELKVLSAEGEARRLMGWGGDLIIVDESCLIDGEVYRQKISRMLGDTPDAMLVEIGNPWHRNNHFYEHWCNGNFRKIQIGWEIGLEEGRITEEFVTEQKRILTPMEFKVLYEADFPDEADDQLIRKEWIDKALFVYDNEIHSDEIAGLDVAEFGIDRTVLTIGYYIGDTFKVREIFDWVKRDTMETVGWTTKYVTQDTQINVDSIGVGSGVFARLTELRYNTTSFKASESPINLVAEKSRFLNKKAETYWMLRDMFEAGIINIPNHPQLVKELLAMTYTITSAGKIKIIDPPKSPDFADSLMIAISTPPMELSLITR